MLDPRASGLRHLRWAREIAAGLHALARPEFGLATPHRADAERLAHELDGAIARCSEAVKAYRDFLERTRVHARAVERLLPHAEASARARLAPFLADTEAERLRRRERLTEQKERLREAVGSALEKARAHPELGPFAPHVAPPIAADASSVVDHADADDDASQAG
jgi:hypothetical protein